MSWLGQQYGRPLGVSGINEAVRLANLHQLTDEYRTSSIEPALPSCPSTQPPTPPLPCLQPHTPIQRLHLRQKKRIRIHQQRIRLRQRLQRRDLPPPQSLQLEPFQPRFVKLVTVVVVSPGRSAHVRNGL